MNSRQKKLLLAHPPDTPTDISQTIRKLVKIFNAGSSDPDNYHEEKWKISNDVWQRYEFLGDRVLNLVVAEYLFSHPPTNPKKENREGWMTKKMGVVSNESLAEIIDRRGYDIGPLIPAVIGQQQCYGERVKGGALEAFIGALYEAYGFEGTRVVILDILSEEIDLYNPDSNFIGNLQEWHQQRGKPVPVYSEIREKRDGPDHSLTFTCRVDTGDGTFLGEGSGKTITESRQAAAKMALERLQKKPE